MFIALQLSRLIKKWSLFVPDEILYSSSKENVLANSRKKSKAVLKSKEYIYTTIFPRLCKQVVMLISNVYSFIHPLSQHLIGKCLMKSKHVKLSRVVQSAAFESCVNSI